MTILELTNFYDERFKGCFRAYFQEIGIRLREDTDVFDDITESCEKENMRVLVLEKGNEFMGFIMFQPEHLQGGFFQEQAGFIRELWVAPSCRRSGYGRSLLRRAEEVFREKGISKLLLTYEEEALGFYKKLGFQPDESYQAKNGGNVVVKYL